MDVSMLEKLFRPDEPEIIIELGGTPFRVDLAHEWIFEIANPSNYIPFNELEEEGHSFRLVYDPKTKNVFKGDDEDMIERFDLRFVELDQLRWMPTFGFVWTEKQQSLRMGR